MSRPQLRHMAMAASPSGPYLAVQLEDGRVFDLQEDDGTLSWRQLPDFPLTDEQRERAETEARARAAGLTMPGER